MADQQNNDMMLGEMRADIRTVKHDIANIQSTLQALDLRLNTLSTSQARGLGFFAGAAFILTSAAGMLLAIGKLMFGGHA